MENDPFAGKIQEQWQTVNWEEGVIGLAEEFFLGRFNFHPMWARSLGTILVSTALGNMDKFNLSDQWGDVYANLFFLYIGRSGVAIKTPPIKLLKNILYSYNKDVLSPTKFNSESFAEYVEGTDGKVHGKKKRKEIQPHPINICVADEASRILGDIKHNPNRKDMLEFLSKLWDNEIEGKYTRSMQVEGNINVYFSMLGASSRHFYKLLEREFFTQGTGNRILYTVEEEFTPPQLESYKFFYQYAESNEFTKFKDKIVGLMRRISDAHIILIDNEAGELWVKYTNKIFKKICAMKDDEAQYNAKVGLNTLKLAMCYSASRLNIDPENLIHIGKEDMKRAIKDSEKYIKMWKLAMAQWAKNNKSDKQDELTSGKYAVQTLVGIAIDNGGTICVSEIRKLGYPDRVQIGKNLNLGVDMGYLEQANIPNKCGADVGSGLTEEELKHYNKICHGNIPNVWRVTENGKKMCGAEV